MVILVEEEPNLRSAIAALLREAGFPVAETDTTNRALQLVQASEASALVTDAHVPGEIDGWELANRARSLRPQIAIVLMSGHSDQIARPRPDGAEFIFKADIVVNLVPTLQRLTGTS